jgi:hypothetical protein
MIKIKRNPMGDTRTATHIPSFTEFCEANLSHCEDVENMMALVAKKIDEAGKKHDFSKCVEPHRSLFYRELCATVDGKMNFTDGKWYPFHCTTERHHLDEYCPTDVNLIDVIEMICDCVCAGVARSGEIRQIEISNYVLQDAIKNTAKMLCESVEVTHE